MLIFKLHHIDLFPVDFNIFEIKKQINTWGKKVQFVRLNFEHYSVCRKVPRSVFALVGRRLSPFLSRSLTCIWFKTHWSICNFTNSVTLSSRASVQPLPLSLSLWHLCKLVECTRLMGTHEPVLTVAPISFHSALQSIKTKSQIKFFARADLSFKSHMFMTKDRFVSSSFCNQHIWMAKDRRQICVCLCFIQSSY